MFYDVKQADDQGGRIPDQEYYIWHNYGLGVEDVISSEYTSGNN